MHRITLVMLSFQLMLISTFGILLNYDAESTSIKLKQEEEHINIKGGGNLKNDTDKNITSLSIGDVTVSHQEDLHVAIKQNLTSFELESLNLFGQSTFGSSIENTDLPKLKCRILK